jgi:hypothetical protein
VSKINYKYNYNSRKGQGHNTEGQGNEYLKLKDILTEKRLESSIEKESLTLTLTFDESHQTKGSQEFCLLEADFELFPLIIKNK